jgi:integrase
LPALGSWDVYLIVTRDSGESCRGAAAESGVGPLGTHAFRHTYRSWLDAVGTPIAVQQKLMRHSDIRTTVNTYGSVVSDEMEKANFRVVGLALKPSTDLRVICVAKPLEEWLLR